MREFFRTLWPASPLPSAWLSFWFYPSKGSLHVPIDGIGELDDDDFAELEAREENVYFGHGARRADLGPTARGKKSDVVALPALVLDIDFFNPEFPDAHVAKNLPRNLDEAAEVLLPGVPEPSIVVSTGNGVHLYWLFREPLLLEDAARRLAAAKAAKAFQAPMLKRAKAHGWQLDSTGQIDRVWRVPGFVNRKTGLRVELLHCSTATRYSFDELGAKMPKAAASTKTKTKTRNPKLSITLENVRAKLQTKLKENECRRPEAIEAMLAGESLAPAGSRDETLQSVCSTLAWLRVGRELTPEEIVEILRPSLTVWANEDGASKTIDEEIEKAIDKITRAREDCAANEEKLKLQYASIARGLGIELSSKPLEFFQQRAIIQYRSSYYVFDFRHGAFSSPKISSEVIPFARDAWKDGPDNLEIDYFDSKGNEKTKTLNKMVAEYVTVADEVIGDLSLQVSRYDEEIRTFYEATTPRRVTVAEYSEQIDAWLRALAGDQIEKLLDWIAAVPQLHHQCCALYLRGPSGVGKGLFAHGIARIWHEGGPTPYVNVNGNFNAELIQCPFCWIDEGLPPKRGGYSDELRALIGRQTFPVNDKYISVRQIRGAVRLVVCANNDDVLSAGSSRLGAEDLEAVAGRFLYIAARPEAAAWLAEHNDGGKMTRDWVEGDALARHVLWLSENRVIKPGKRFLVEGDESVMHRTLVMQGDDEQSAIYELIVRYASDPKKYLRGTRTNGTPRAFIGDCQILINTQFVIDVWQSYRSGALMPSTSCINSVLKKLSAGRQKRLGPRGDRLRYYALNVELVLEWCRQNQVGSEEKIVENLNAELKDTE